MTYTQECAACKHIEPIEEDARTPWVRCSECGAKVVNPGWSDRRRREFRMCPVCAKRSPAESAWCVYCSRPFAPPEPVQGESVACPACAQPVPIKARSCPHCREKFVLIRPFDAEFPKNSTLLGKFPLSFFGAVGLGYWIATTHHIVSQTKAAAFFALGLAFAAGLVMSENRSNRTLQAVGRLFLAPLTVLGVVTISLAIAGFCAGVFLLFR